MMRSMPERRRRIRSKPIVSGRGRKRQRLFNGGKLEEVPEQEDLKSRHHVLVLIVVAVGLAWRSCLACMALVPCQRTCCCPCPSLTHRVALAAQASEPAGAAAQDGGAYSDGLHVGHGGGAAVQADVGGEGGLEAGLACVRSHPVPSLHPSVALSLWSAGVQRVAREVAHGQGARKCTLGCVSLRPPHGPALDQGPIPPGLGSKAPSSPYPLLRENRSADTRGTAASTTGQPRTEALGAMDRGTARRRIRRAGGRHWQAGGTGMRRQWRNWGAWDACTQLGRLFVQPARLYHQLFV